MNKLSVFFKKIKDILPILDEIIKKGGVPYLVGGSIRDLVLNLDIKDMDIEVHKISLETLEKCLKKFGHVKLVGKKFGVLKLTDKKFDIDWSLPRKDTKGRKPKVKIDPNMTIKQACKRRDLTMNAMAIDLKFVTQNFKKLSKKTTKLNDLKILDPFGGLKDIRSKKLRTVDKKLFLEDPLRFFRVMQFIGRFEMQPDKNLNALCKKMDLYDITANAPLAKERIFEEIKKLFLKSTHPSLGFRWLDKIGRLQEIFPELYVLKKTKQRKNYHPEGNVFEHTMQTIDAGAVLNKYYNDEEKLMIMLGLLCHDLGKAVTTDKDLSCFGHDKAGVPIAKKLLKRITSDRKLINSVGKLVQYHTRPISLIKQKAKLKAYRRLAVNLAPELSIRQMAMTNLCDIRGRNAKGHEPLKGIYEDKFKEVLQKAEEAKSEHGPIAPVLFGRHLLDVIKPGPELGQLLKKAYKIQLENGIEDWKELKRKVLEK
jgi:tRNA nucleotidyltransferase (CCA-adding enzyme)